MSPPEHSAGAFAGGRGHSAWVAGAVAAPSASAAIGVAAALRLAFSFGRRIVRCWCRPIGVGAVVDGFIAGTLYAGADRGRALGFTGGHLQFLDTVHVEAPGDSVVAAAIAVLGLATDASDGISARLHASSEAVVTAGSAIANRVELVHKALRHTKAIRKAVGRVEATLESALRVARVDDGARQIRRFLWLPHAGARNVAELGAGEDGLRVVAVAATERGTGRESRDGDGQERMVHGDLIGFSGPWRTSAHDAGRSFWLLCRWDIWRAQEHCAKRSAT